MITVSTSFFARLAMVTMALAAAGCSPNPIATAETPNQKAGALLGVWNILYEDAVLILEDRSIPNSIAMPINNARIAGTRIAQSLAKALVQYEIESAKLAAGETTAEKLTIAADNLDRWLDQLQAVYINLAQALARAKADESAKMYRHTTPILTRSLLWI